MKDNRTSPFLSDLSKGVRTLSGSMKNSGNASPATPAAASYGRFNNFSDSSSSTGTVMPDFSTTEKSFTVLEGIPNNLGATVLATGSIGDFDIYGTKIYSDMTLADGTKFRTITAQRGFRLPLYRDAAGDATERVFLGRDFTDLWPDSSMIDAAGITFMLKFLILQTPNGKALLSVGTGTGSAEVAFNIAFDNAGRNIVVSHKADTSDSSVTVNIENHYDKFVTLFASPNSSTGSPVVQNVALYDTATGELLYGLSNGSNATGNFKSLTKPRLYIGYGEASGGSNNAFDHTSFLKNINIAEVAVYKGILTAQQQDVIARSTLAEVPYKSGFNNRAPRKTQQILDSRTAYPNSSIPESKPTTTIAFDDTTTHTYGTGSAGGEKQSLMFPEMLPANMFSGSVGSSIGATGDTRKFYRDVHHTPFDKRLVAQGVIRQGLPHQETELLNLASRNSPATISQDTVALGGSIEPFHDDNPILDLVSRRAVSAGTFPDLDQRLGDHVAIIIELNPSQDATIGVERDAAGVSTGRVTSMAYFNFSTNKWETAGKNNDFVIPGAVAIPTGSLTDSLADKYRTVAANTATALYSSASVGFAGTSGFTIFQNTGADSLSSLSLRGAPTSNYGFPTANKYEAKDNQLINMSDYIDAPFILERVQFQFGAAIEESGPHSLGYRQDAPSNDLGSGEKQLQSPMMQLDSGLGVVYPHAPQPEGRQRYLGRGDFINGSDIWHVDDPNIPGFTPLTDQTFSTPKASAVASLIMGKADSTRGVTSQRQFDFSTPKAVTNPTFKFHPGEKTEAGYSAPIIGNTKRNSRLFLPTALGPRETYQSLTTRLTPDGDPIPYIPVVAGGLNGVVTGSLSTDLEAGPLVLVRHSLGSPEPEGVSADWGSKGMMSGVPFWRADTFFLLRQSKTSSVAKEYNFRVAFGRESLMMPVAPYSSIDPGNVFHAQNVSAKNRSRLFSKFGAGEFDTTILSNCATSRDLVTYGQMTHYGFAAAADSYMDTIWDTPSLDSSFASGSYGGSATGHDPVFQSEIFNGSTPVSLPLFGQAIKFAHQIDFANIVFPSNPDRLDKNTSMLSDAPDTFQGQYSFFAGEGSHINNNLGLPGFRSISDAGAIAAEASRRVHPHDARYYAAGMDKTIGPYNLTGYERLLSLDTWMATPFAGEVNPVTAFLSSSAYFKANPGSSPPSKSQAYQANVAGSGFSIITTPAWPTAKPHELESGALAYNGYGSYPEFNDYGTFDRRPESGVGRRASLGDAPAENWLQAGLGKEVNYFVSGSSKHEGVNPDYPDSWAGFTLMTASTAWRPFSSPGRESAAIGLQANVYKRQYLDYRKKIVLDVPVKSTLPLPIEAPGYWVTTSENERSPAATTAQNPFFTTPDYAGTETAVLRIPERGDPTGTGGVTGPAYRRARSAKRFHQRNTSIIKDSGFSAGTNADNMSSSRNFIRSTGAALPTSVKAVSAIPYGVNRTHRASNTDLGWSQNADIDNLINFSTLDKKSPKKSSQESLYVLKPGDKLILGVQPSLPGWNPGSGLPNNRHASKYGIWDYSGSISSSPRAAMTHDLAADGVTIRDGLMNMEDPYEPSHGLTMLAGPSRVVLYGTLMKDNKHKPSNSTQVINSAAVHEALHYDNPVLDQFLTDGAGEYSGNTLGQLVDGKMTGVSELIGDARRIIGDIGTGNLTFSGSFQRFTRSSEGSQVFYDTLLQDPFEIGQASGHVKKWGKESKATYSIINMHNPTAFVASASAAYLDSTTVATAKFNYIIDGTWPDSFPFEEKYSNVSRLVTRDMSFVLAGNGNPDPGVDVKPGFYHQTLAGPVTRDITTGNVDNSEGTNPSAANLLSGSNPPDNNTGGDDLGREHWELLRELVAASSLGSNHLNEGLIVAGIRNMANTRVIEGDIHYGAIINNKLLPKSATGIKDYRLFTAAMVGFGRQNKKQLDFSYDRFYSRASITSVDGSSRISGIYGTAVRFHPAGFKYGYMNCDHLSPSMIHRGDRYGQFRDMLEQRLYGKTYNYGDEFNKRGEAESAVSCIFVDADGSPITDSTKTQCLNLSTTMTSSKPFIEGEVMREIIFSSESVTIE